MRNYIVAIFFTLAGNLAISATFESTGGGGNWTDPGSWLEDGVAATNTPGAGDTIIVYAGDIIVVNSQLNFSSGAPMYLEILGTLNFNNGQKLRMAAGSGVKVLSGGQINPGSGGGASNVIQIDGVNVWQTSDGTLNGPSDLGTTPIIPVPIENIILIAFENSEGVLLKWVANIENVDSYIIYRSSDLVEWNFLGQVDAGQKEYEYEDKDNYEGLVYYKVTAEYDNQSVISSRIFSFSQDALEELRIYPNPSTSYIFLEGSNLEPESLRIHDNSGRERTFETIKYFNTLQINIQDLPEGAYFLTIATNQQSKSMHFIKK